VTVGPFPRLSSRHDLSRLLTLTLRRARDLAQRETHQRRDRGRTAAAGDLFDLGAADLDRLTGSAPDPALAAEVADELQFLMARLPGDDRRVVARELLAGYTAPETARRFGCSRRTVERRWQRIRQY
jgi:DNA-directed RNA polymerase specialized sigma24 family protein